MHAGPYACCLRAATEGVPMLGTIALLLALGLAAKGLMVRQAERALLARLAPVAARVTRRGDVASLNRVPATDSQGQSTERIEHVFVGEWEYSVDGKTHRGSIEQISPVFRQDQMPPATIQVFYDRDNPSISRLHRDRSDGMAKAWSIFAAVVAAVGVLLLVIPGLGGN